MPVVKVYDESGNLIREGSPRDEDKKGFIVRYELLGIIVIMLIQTMGGIWWAATQTERMVGVRNELYQIKTQMTAFTDGTYKTADAEKAHFMIDKRIDKVEVRMDKLEQFHNKGGI